ncbi:MAG: response regulator [Xanthobacteraceae bacterium]
MAATAAVRPDGPGGNPPGGYGSDDDGSFQLLLVEDNPGDVDLVRERLSASADHKFELTCVTRLRDAIDVLHSARIDAVLLDLSLPDSSGLETLRRLRAAREDVAIVVFSGIATEELRRLALRAGAQDFIGKDEPPALLLARIMPTALERHRALEQHRQVERLVSAMPDAVIVTDTNRIVRFVNEAAVRLFGQSQDRLLGTPFEYSVIDEVASEITIVRGAETRSGELRAVSCEWERKPAFLVTIRDTTEQKTLSEQLRQAQKMEAVGLLAGGIAHDFNNLLLVILFYAEFLRDRIEEADPRRVDLVEILRAVDRARALTGQLLAFSRKQAIRPRVVDLTEIVLDIAHLLQRTFPAHCEIVARTSQGVWPVLVDGGQVEQLLMNLAVNARDAMPSGGRVTIAVENVPLDQPTPALPSGDYVALRVSDTGKGIAPEDLDRIFEPFFTTKEQGKGTGLGLATCYAIARHAGGDVAVRSEIGSGATFSVFFPRVDGIPGDASPVRPLPEQLDGTETILVVEDNPTVLRSTCRILTQHGYSVLTATNGEQALRIFRETDGPIDLVLTDLIMPQMTGAELIERLDVSDPHLNVLFTTGYSDDALEQALLDFDRPILIKPYPPRELLHRIREILDVSKYPMVSPRAG